tara:strand:+ start:244 stop:1068 length:825 start_codon:yes stop_codon:yes gene_type:complete
MKNQVISLYDFTGEALRPWAEAGYQCFAYDIQHNPSPMGPMQPSNFEPFNGGGNIFFIHADLYDPKTSLKIIARHNNKVVFLSAFPPCTDLAVSGAMWWKRKGEANPDFQKDAASHVERCAMVGDAFDCPYYIENPIGALTRLWRKPDHKFDPCDFGGYLSEDDVHPRWPEIIPPRDAYRKKTCLWVGNRFKMPTHRQVDHETMVFDRKDPKKGKSQRTKNIRSATPRGFAKAVFFANAMMEKDGDQDICAWNYFNPHRQFESWMECMTISQFK